MASREKGLIRRARRAGSTGRRRGNRAPANGAERSADGQPHRKDRSVGVVSRRSRPAAPVLGGPARVRAPSAANERYVVTIIIIITLATATDARRRGPTTTAWGFGGGSGPRGYSAGATGAKTVVRSDAVPPHSAPSARARTTAAAADRPTDRPTVRRDAHAVTRPPAAQSTTRRRRCSSSSPRAARATVCARVYVRARARVCVRVCVVIIPALAAVVCVREAPDRRTRVVTLVVITVFKLLSF